MLLENFPGCCLFLPAPSGCHPPMPLRAVTWKETTQLSVIPLGCFTSEKGDLTLCSKAISSEYLVSDLSSTFLTAGREWRGHRAGVLWGGPQQRGRAQKIEACHGVTGSIIPFFIMVPFQKNFPSSKKPLYASQEPKKVILLSRWIWPLKKKSV